MPSKAEVSESLTFSLISKDQAALRLIQADGVLYGEQGLLPLVDGKHNVLWRGNIKRTDQDSLQAESIRVANLLVNE